MSVWGKLLGGSAGLVLGGPLGAVLGLAVGHGVDKIRKADSKYINKNNYYNSAQFSANDKQMAFATGVIVLSAKLAKADGKVTKDEIKTFKSIFDFDSRDEIAIGKIYNEALGELCKKTKSIPHANNGVKIGTGVVLTTIIKLF